MPGRLIYELPQGRDDVCKIVRAIPSNWFGIDGDLMAPEKLYEQPHLPPKLAEKGWDLMALEKLCEKKNDGSGSCEVAENTYLMISRYGGVRPSLNGINDILLNRKLFAKIQFEEAGVRTPGMNIEAVKELIEGYLDKGYRGWIEAYNKPCKENETVFNPELIYLDHESKKTIFEWNEKFGGMRKNIERIVKNLSELRLKKLDYQEWSA